mgnify:CR=1 FL=1
MDKGASNIRGGAAIITLVVLAAIFYFWHLSRPDIITDESSYAVRAIGMVDFDFGIEQPTPWQWVEKVPWWMRLSFHDHPPLVFLLQHYSMRIFGETPFAIRLPSVLAGLMAVFLVYLIGKRLYSPAVGLASAALFAFTINHVWISRIGLQESIAIALMLASAYFFFRALGLSISMVYTIDIDRNSWRRGAAERDGRWLIAAGAFFGLAFLAKYHALILIPIFSTLLFVPIGIYKNDRFYRYRLRNGIVLAVLLFVAIASPVIIYNIQLYRDFGHFDFQFSQLFHQDVAAWQARPGQEVLGSYPERIRTFVPRLIEANSPYFLMLSAIGLALILWQLLHRYAFNRALVISHSSLVIVLAWFLLLLVFIGPAHRFLTLLTPWLAIVAGYFISQTYSQILKNLRIGWTVVFAAFALFIVFEAWYSYNSVIALDPVGARPWAYSYLHRQAGSWGFNELNTYLDGELKDKMPDPAITFQFPFAREILNTALAEYSTRGAEPTAAGIVYNDNINLSSQLWVFLRRIIYDGWPVVSAENFRSGGAEQFFREAGIKRVYFINPTSAALQDRTRLPTPDGDIIEAELKAEGLTPEEIKNARGEVAFRVYQFELPQS